MSQIAAIQMAAGPNTVANLTEAARLIDMAVQAGANMLVLPENFAHMGMNEVDKLAISEQEGEGPIQQFLRDQARANNVWIVGGTLPIATQDPARIRSSCLVFNDNGEQVARYDKIHLFDVSLDATGENYAESETIEAGDQLVVFESPFGRVGLAVCYDIRFPEMFRKMHQQQVEIIALPSAFTATTGRAHWEQLVRARAIENLCYVVAADQGGYHVNGRETHGHSMIVDPWGNVMDILASGSGYVMANIDIDQLHQIRRTFPALRHRHFVHKTSN
jgi:predicted amidohydrolase